MNTHDEYAKLYGPMPHPSPIALYWMDWIHKLIEGNKLVKPCDMTKKGGE